LRPRARVAAQRPFSRSSLILAFGIAFVGLAISLGPTKPDFHISWHTPVIEIPAFGDFDQQLAQKYFLLPSVPVDSESTPLLDPGLPALAVAPRTPAPAVQTAAVTPVAAPPVAVPPVAAAPLAALPLAALPPAAAAAVPAADPGAALAAQFAGTQPDTSTPSPLSAAVEQVIQIEKGDTLMSVLTDAGIPNNEAHAAVMALSDIFSPRALKPGQPIKLTLASDDQPDGNAGAADQPILHLMALTLDPSVEKHVELTRSLDGAFSAKSKDVPLEIETTRAVGTIQTSLFEAGQAEGVPVAIMGEVIHAFSYDVDFQRDFQPGDKFEIVYKHYLNEAGELAKSGDIDFASLTLSGRELKLYRYTLPDGRVDWFNPKGDSVRKALLRTPIDGARITSGYGVRVHPILGYSLMHKGVDFGAPMGTPIFAAGDGVIAQIGPYAGFGNYIRVKHNATYATAYGHISRFAGGLHAGSRVKQGQVIAYVGMTGRATGPHLHFEVLINGRQVNPQSIKLPTGEKLQGKQLKQFLAYAANLDRQRRDLAQKALVAQGN
jgi:murein DD-endopeptidase MepM/ murein hydrolase activator NlpD